MPTAPCSTACATNAEPSDWLIDAVLDDDARLRADDFGVALNLAYDSAGDGAFAYFDNVAMYDAETVSADAPLP